MNSKEIKTIKKEVLKQILPTKKESQKLNHLYKKIENYIKQLDKENKIKRIELVGSIAKNTYLKNSRDLDIFLFFSENTPREELEEYALNIGKKLFNMFSENYEIKYAEHPYVKGIIEGIEVEIVPAYALEKIEKVKSAVDRTPFHKKYVIEHLKNHDDVRILKKFLKSIGTYGSELYVQGFSGYACELLIIKYKTFENVLKKLASINYNEVICLGECDIKSSKQKFKDAPLIIIDPVDPNRNVTAALSKHSLAKTKFYAKQFLLNPSIRYFFIDEKYKPKISKIKKQIKENSRHYFIAAWKNTHEEIADTIYPQLEKLRKLVLREYKNEEFYVERSFSFYDDEYYGIYFEFNSQKYANYYYVLGPSMFVKNERIKGFLKKYDSYYINDNGELVANTKRKYILPEEYFSLLKEKKYEELRSTGIPKSLAKNISLLNIIHNISVLKNQKMFIRKITYDSEIIKWIYSTKE